MNDIVKTFIHRFDVALSQSGKTQKDIAVETGLTETTISRYINGLRAPNIVNLLKIAKALGVSADYLVGLDGVNE